MLNFKKIFLSVFLFINLFVVNSHSEVVKTIEINGNERISSETIIVFGDILIGKDYKSSDVNQLIKKLFDTSFFSDISINLANNKLSITVKENPIINSIVFKGEKAKKFKEKILELVTLKEKASYI